MSKLWAALIANYALKLWRKHPKNLMGSLKSLIGLMEEQDFKMP